MARPIQGRGLPVQRPERVAHREQTSDVEQTFRELVVRWKRETSFLSSIQQKAMNPAYQRIIGLGPLAVPLLLRELLEDPGHWFWALSSITGEDPASGATTFDEAAEAWLAWGKDRGHLR